MRRLLTFSVISALGVAGAAISAPVYAADAASTWEHNGSTVALEKNGEQRRIVYVRPKAALTKAGVKRGTVLFNGKTKKDGRVAGYAKIFRVGCDPVDYFVEGKVDLSKGEMVLQGQAPVYSGKNCKITGYSDDNASSTLTFTSESGPRNQDYADNGADDGVEQGDGGDSARDDSQSAQNNNRTAQNSSRTAQDDSGDVQNDNNDDRASSSQEERDYASRNDERDDYDSASSRNRQQRGYADSRDRSYRRSYDDRADDYSDDADPDGEYADDYYEPAPRTERRYRPYRPWWRN